MRAKKFTPGQRATGTGAEIESSKTFRDDNTTDIAAGQLTGAARYRHEKREAAIWLLMNLDEQDAATICATVLDEIGAGFPRLDWWGDAHEEAAEWAYRANSGRGIAVGFEALS